MNWRRAGISAVSGAVSLASLFGGVWAAIYLVLSDGSAGWFGGVRLVEIPTWLALAGVLIVSASAALCLTLPALALGASRRRSLVAASFEGVTFILLVFITIFPTPFKAVWIQVALVAMPAAMVIYASQKIVPKPTIVAVIVIAATLCMASILLFLAFPGSVESLMVAASSWLVLPALAGASARRDE